MLPVAKLCRSHGEPISWIETNLSEFIFAGQYRCDLQFLGCVLRLADYLDLDPARAPESLLRLIKPRSEKSLREWRKNQAASIVVDGGEILCQAEFTDFFEEKALRDTIQEIEEERRACIDFLELRRRRSDKNLSLKLASPIRTDQIKSDGYFFEEFRFQLEYKEILSLLMGTKLYRDERVFLREMIQNAIDACRSAKAAVEKIPGHNFQGEVTIRRKIEADGSEIIEVSDNGSGMTKDIIQNYFMRVGRSYYQSYAFKRKNLEIHPISQFGIGILSCFMVADKLEVETLPHSAVHPIDECGEYPGLFLEIRGPSEFFVVRPFVRSAPGTTVRVFLRQSLQGCLDDLVSRFLARAPLAIRIVDGESKTSKFHELSFDFDPHDVRAAFAAMPGAFGYTFRDVSFVGPLGFGIFGKIRLCMLEKNGKSYLHLNDLEKYSYVGFSPTGETRLEPKHLTPEVRRNLDQIIDYVSRAKMHFYHETQCELSSILQRFNRLADALLGSTPAFQIERQWNALRAQIDALQSMPSFTAKPQAISVLPNLRAAADQIRAFVSGRVEFPLPQSVLTQDGLLLSEFFDLTDHLRLGIGYIFNLDLCGAHRVSLNAARDAVLPDKRRDSLIFHLHQRLGKEIGLWFREENIPLEDVEEYLAKVPRSLGEFVIRWYERPS